MQPVGPEHVDVLIVGAGISGIGAAVHLQQRCPGKRFVIVERRARPGGTWDLFRYPGVRSDSDMFTLGFRFKPWTAQKAIADGPAILDYLDETVREHHLADRIRFDHHVVRAAWSGDTATWTVDLAAGADRTPVTMSASFVFMCGGYYDYDHGYLPDFAGREAFTGPVVHPQHWPADLDYGGRRVVVIGSGATAVTLVPALVAPAADRKPAAHVTMLQRTPTYMVSRPSIDRTAERIRRLLPRKAAYAVIRWRNILQGRLFFTLARKRPEKIKRLLLAGVRAELGPDANVERDFTPPYNPWDQRLCLVPDSDLFAAVRRGDASVVTGQIDRFTATGVRLQDGRELPADVIVTATGLNLQMLGGVEVSVDGARVHPGDTVLHKGILLSGIPNLAMWFGYTNASWTLKADLTSDYVCRLLHYMDAAGTPIVTARYTGPDGSTESFVDFSSGYFKRAAHLLPHQGTKVPWRLNQNYLKDLRLLRRGRIDDDGLVFARTRSPAAVSAPSSTTP